MATKSLLEAFGYAKPRSRKLNARQLRSLVLNEAMGLAEDADAAKVDDKRFPLKLSQAAGKAGEEAELLATGGDADGEQEDDVVQAAPGSKPVKKLSPSQTSMDIDKAVAFAVAALLKNDPFPAGPGGDLGAIITSDDHIMDGHHRWIASGMIDPNSEVGGVIVEFPAEQMIAALNMITVSLGITKGKPGTGSFAQFNEAGILPVLQGYAENGVWSAGGESDEGAANVVKALEVWTGEEGDAAVTAAAAKMAVNVGKLKTEVPGHFPGRPDMPVISFKKGHLKKAVALLRSGQVDLNEPYADAAAAAEGDEAKANESAGPVRRDDIILERWQKLAGLLKS
jgi:hypothetical protein